MQIYAVSGEVVVCSSIPTILPLPGGPWYITIHYPGLIENCHTVLPPTLVGLVEDFQFLAPCYSSTTTNSTLVGLLQLKRWINGEYDLVLAERSITRLLDNVPDPQVYAPNDFPLELLQGVEVVLAPSLHDPGGPVLGIWTDSEEVVAKQHHEITACIEQWLKERTFSQVILDPKTHLGHVVAKLCKIYSLPYSAIRSKHSPETVFLQTANSYIEAPESVVPTYSRADTVLCLTNHPDRVPTVFRQATGTHPLAIEILGIP